MLKKQQQQQLIRHFTLSKAIHYVSYIFKKDVVLKPHVTSSLTPCGEPSALLWKEYYFFLLCFSFSSLSYYPSPELPSSCLSLPSLILSHLFRIFSSSVSLLSLRSLSILNSSLSYFIMDPSFSFLCVLCPTSSSIRSSPFPSFPFPSLCTTLSCIRYFFSPYFRDVFLIPTCMYQPLSFYYYHPHILPLPLSYYLLPIEHHLLVLWGNTCIAIPSLAGSCSVSVLSPSRTLHWLINFPPSTW